MCVIALNCGECSNQGQGHTQGAGGGALHLGWAAKKTSVNEHLGPRRPEQVRDGQCVWNSTEQAEEMREGMAPQQEVNKSSSAWVEQR